MHKITKRCILFAVITIAGLNVSFCIEAGLAQEKSLEKVTLALQWHTQCQFAGYYVALDKGFYKEEGIDLTITPGATDINPIHLVSSEIADFGTKWLADFMAAKDKGLSLVSIAQVLQSNGLMLIAKADSGIRTPQDFVDKKVSIWFFGNETQFFTLLNKLHIPPDRMYIEAQKWSMDPFIKGKVDVSMAMIYNEYLRVLDSGYQENDINIIDFTDYGLNFPGHVIFTRSMQLKNRPELCERMVRASLQGWAWAMDHPDEAVDIVLKHDETKSLKRAHQLKQMRAMIKLIAYGNRPLGYHSPEQVAFVMHALHENNVISRLLDMSDVYTNQVWKRARLEKKE